MKHFLLVSLLTLLFLGCKKESTVTNDSYLETVKKGLGNSLGKADYQNLNFAKSVLSKVDSVNLYVLRIPFNGKSVAEDFVVIKTNKEGRIERGKIIHQQGSASDVEIRGGRRKSFNGAISISSLDRKAELNSSIVDGYITALHSSALSRTALVQAGDVMPEVVITYILPSSGGFSWSFWMDLQSYFYDGGGDSWDNYYGSYQPDAGGGGSPSGDPYSGNPPTGGGGGLYLDPPLLIDVEPQDENEAVDIEKIINCLNAIPDAGAICSIEIMADIPVDSDPDKIFNFTTKSPGHTFLNIRKRNGSQSVSQNIGFYPKSGLKTILTNAPVDGKFVNNEQHEFNCGFTETITPAQLQHVITEMQRSKNRKYDIDNYNCTDWALDVFNASGAFNLQVPLYDIPGNYPSLGTRMPNSVYVRLKEMKTANVPQAAGIDIGFLKAYAGMSTGPCN